MGALVGTEFHRVNNVFLLVGSTIFTLQTSSVPSGKSHPDRPSDPSRISRVFSPSAYLLLRHIGIVENPAHVIFGQAIALTLRPPVRTTRAARGHQGINDAQQQCNESKRPRFSCEAFDCEFSCRFRGNDVSLANGGREHDSRMGIRSASRQLGTRAVSLPR